MKFDGDEREWYFILVAEWLVPTESCRRVFEDTYDNITDARSAALELLEKEKGDFEEATRLKSSVPAECGALTYIMTPDEGQEDEWYECVKIVPMAYGVMPIIGNRFDIPKELE